jgi:hypothetical protein
MQLLRAKPSVQSTSKTRGATRRSFLMNLGSLALAVTALPQLVGCATTKPAQVALLSAASGNPASPLAFLYSVQSIEADLLRQALNRASGQRPDAKLPREGEEVSLRIAVGSMSPEQAASGLQQLVSFARAAAAHQGYLAKALKAAKQDVPAASKAHFALERQNMAALLDSLYPVAELTQRAYLAVISESTDMRQIQSLASIHSVKTGQVAALAMLLSADPNPRRFEVDQQATATQFSENQMEYYREPDQIMQALSQYMA